MNKHACRLAVLLCSAVSLYAQLNKATLTGVVADPSGAAIVNARIAVVHTATNTTFSTTTTETGNYTIPALDIGTYRVEAEAPGFKKALREGVTLASARLSDWT
jgi:hypothetical protein